MNKKGMTILELLLSIVLSTTVLLLFTKVMFSLTKINSSSDFASDDEINRAKIIKNIETDFINLKLKDVSINNNVITFRYLDTTKELKIEDKKLTYDNISYSLKSSNATYKKEIEFKKEDIDTKYFLININIPVLINNKNTTSIDDITLSYLGLKDNNESYTN